MGYKKNLNKLIYLIALLAVSILFYFFTSQTRGESKKYSDVFVERVVDGDTLKLSTGERVRLIGIDTPEMHDSQKLTRDSQRSGTDVKAIKALGRQAYQFTKNLVEGKRISLEFDVEKYDKYKRLLAYVHLKDGTFVNAEIVKQGYASLMTFPPNVKYADLFVKLYKEARENKRGLWSNEAQTYGTQALIDK